MDPSADFPRPVEEKLCDATRIHRNEVYGRYTVASRLIKTGELILEEFPLISNACGTANPCGPPCNGNGADPENGVPFCLTCGQHLDASEVCSKCKWPICNNQGVCENDPLHAGGECPIFTTNQLLPEKKLTLSEYGGINVLRTLLTRSRDTSKWNQILELQAHLEDRKLSSVDCQEMEFVIDFIGKKCKMTQFETEIIERVTGILAVNSYWAFPDLGRYMSLLFVGAATFVAHDCDPNTRREIVEKEQVTLNGVRHTRKEMSIRITATRVIQPGEMITISYIPRTHHCGSVLERQEYLKTYFYFTCECNRCVQELKGNGNINRNI